MAGMSVTVTEPGSYEATLNRISLIKFAWTSDAAGNVSGTTTTNKYNGVLVGAAFLPGAATPTAGYDVAVKDENGVDVLMAQGLTCIAGGQSSATTSSLGAVVDSTLEPQVVDAGNTKTGTIYLYLRGFG